MIEAVLNFLTPEMIVVICYTAAGIMSLDGRSKKILSGIDIPFFSAFTIAGLLIIFSSLYYQLMVVDITTGIQNIFDSVTNFFGIGIALIGFAKGFFDIK